MYYNVTGNVTGNIDYIEQDYLCQEPIFFMRVKMINSPHARLNPLNREWVLVSPQRSKRLWLGQTEKLMQTILPQYDPNCYLCPGNQRAGGMRNPEYTGVFLFKNDFPALLSKKPKSGETTPSIFFHKVPVTGS